MDVGGPPRVGGGNAVHVGGPPRVGGGNAVHVGGPPLDTLLHNRYMHT